MNKLTYIIEFPLVKNDKFILFHIYSIPILHTNTSLYSTILPEQPFLATNPTRQQYITTGSMKQCKTFAPEKWVCNLPVYNYQTRPTCEMDILVHASSNLPTTCEPTTFSAHINMFQPIDINKWIYVLQNETNSILRCDDSSKHINLQGAGVLTLPRGCKLYSSFITLTAAQETSKNISHPIILVDIEDYCKNSEELPTVPDLVPIQINNVPMDALKTIQEELKKQSAKIKSYKESSIIERHASKLSIFTYFIGISMLSFLMYKICKRCSIFSLFRRRSQHDHEMGCIQIFNNCFDRRRHRTHVAIPLSTLNTTISSTENNISDDEDNQDIAIAAATSHHQKLGTAQSLF